ncbi:hypothetical protein ACH5RR_022832 [Cinchona calisaya]|uniref:3'-5' exonuclease domain-containing protein n=1 Tax=Cinchona calisaya TaxID=153742 RepID=A0ABD2Z8X8_9GENT
MNIPWKYLSKMAGYNIKLNGVDIKATVVDQPTLVETGIAELKSRLVGDLKLAVIDLKKSSINPWHPHLMLIYVKDRCMIIDLGSISITKSLADFLIDRSIIFIGFKIDSKLHGLRSSLTVSSFINTAIKDSLMSAKGVEICDLAARVLKNPGLLTCGSIAEFVTKGGFDFKVEDDRNKHLPDCAATCFSAEEVKQAMHEAYICYSVANKLLSML